MMKLKRTIAALVALAVIAACAASLALTGDVDGDGAIGVKDAVLLCRAIADGVVFPRDAQNAAYSKDVK